MPNNQVSLVETVVPQKLSRLIVDQRDAMAEECCMQERLLRTCPCLVNPKPVGMIVVRCDRDMGMHEEYR